MMRAPRWPRRRLPDGDSPIVRADASVRSVDALQVGILPLTLRDTERAGILLDSLGRCWRGDAPFRLVIVTPSRDARAIAAALHPRDGIEIEIHPESEFFRPLSAFRRLSGWWKQQLLKLAVPATLDFGAYLTFDADVIALRPFDGTTFIRDGRLLSQWEPKSVQPWWASLSERLGEPYRGDDHGLSVTPNTLHSDVSGAVIRSIEERFGAEIAAILAKWCRTSGGDAWTEYSLYTLVASQMGLLFRYHVEHEAVWSAGIRLHSSENAWFAEDVDRIFARGSAGLDGHFVIVQSTTEAPIADLRRFALGELPTR